MAALSLLHGSQLVRTGLFLKLRFPGLVRHAVDGFTALVLGHCHALGVGRILEPIRQAIAAEAGQIHQIDVLHISARPQRLDQAPNNAASSSVLVLSSMFAVLFFSQKGYWILSG